MAQLAVCCLLLASTAVFFGCSLAAPTTIPPPLPAMEVEEADVSGVSVEAELVGAANRSQPASCQVAGDEYTHGQQVPRTDPCELCLCLAGDLFCWWQDCPTASTACRQSPAFAAACAAVAENGSTPAGGGVSSSDVVTESAAWPTTGGGEEASSSDSTPPDPDNSSDTAAPPPPPAPASTAPTACHVMGTEYKIGEVLPRDTGTCLECVCDSEARVTCSPKNCASHDDFHASNSLDMFDVDTF